MDERDSSRQDDGFGSLVAALRRTKREVGVAVGHGVTGVKHWVGERWFPVRLVLLGGFSWTMSKVFGWLLGGITELGNWLTSTLVGVAVLSTFGTQILLLLFTVSLLHSAIQTKLIWGVKTNLTYMTSGDRVKARTDGGSPEKIWLPAGAISGIIAGATVGWSFGLEGIFVGAGLGWVLGDEFDRWFDEKFMQMEYPIESEEHYSE